MKATPVNTKTPTTKKPGKTTKAKTPKAKAADLTGPMTRAEELQQNGGPTGPCPWCGETMGIGDEDPILERICLDCATVPPQELAARYPEQAARVQAANTSVEEEHTPVKTKTPKAKTTQDKTPVETQPPAVESLPGVTIRAEVMTYTPDLHRPRLHIKTPTGAYYKLVPGVRTTTKAEALTAAQTYREQILATGQLPPKGERQAKAKPPATPATPTLVIPGVTRVEVD